MSPPTIATPSGSRSSEPTPWPNPSGTPPSSAAIVVMMIGRERGSGACSIASRAGRPSERSASSPKAIIMHAVLLKLAVHMTIRGGAERDARSQVEGDRYRRELALVADGERGGALLDRG